MSTAVSAVTVADDRSAMPIVPAEGPELAKGGSRLNARNGGSRSVMTCAGGAATSLSSGRSSVGLDTSWKVPAAAYALLALLPPHSKLPSPW